MKILKFTSIFMGLFVYGLTAQTDYHTLHEQSIVVDTHTDVLLQVLRGADISKRMNYGHVDLIRLNEGGVDVQFFAKSLQPTV